MPKTCNHESCENFVFGGGYCKYHQYLRNDKPLKSVSKKEYKIPQVSKKQAKLNAAYSKLRELFLKQHPLCQANLQTCTKIATDVHHKEGRTGRQNCPLIV